MQILMLSSQYSPEAQKNQDELSWQLAGQFVKQGHDVRVITSGNFDLNQCETTLAQRLTPIAIEINNVTIDYTRFDTKTTSGIEVYILKAKNDVHCADAYTASALGKAAASLIGTVDFSPDFVIVWNNEFKLKPPLSSCPQTIAAFTQFTNGDSLDSFGKCIVHGQPLASSIVSNSSGPLALKISTGKASVFPLACDVAPMDSLGKSSAKASLQTATGLPVLPNVPLFYIRPGLAQPELITQHLLQRILSLDIQILLHADSLNVANLAQTYPDRLCVLPQKIKEETIIAASDFCIQPNDIVQVAKSIAAFTIPVVPQGTTAAVLDLDPAMQSGNGLTFVSSETSIEETIRKAAGMFNATSAFTALSKRLANEQISLDTLAKQIVAPQ